MQGNPENYGNEEKLGPKRIQAMAEAAVLERLIQIISATASSTKDSATPFKLISGLLTYYVVLLAKPGLENGTAEIVLDMHKAQLKDMPQTIRDGIMRNK